MDISSREIEARRLRELFKGRFDQETALKLNEDLGGVIEAVDFLLNEDEGQVAAYLKQCEDYLKNLRIDSEKVAQQLENNIDFHVRQFVCGPCHRSWWKRVPVRKEVSRCRRCKVRYDPIPREHESGMGKFICPCGNEFTGFGTMGETESECYKCGVMVLVSHMLPPRRDRDRARKTKTPHSCNGIGCYNQNHGHGQVTSSNVDIEPYQNDYRTSVSMSSGRGRGRGQNSFNAGYMTGQFSRGDKSKKQGDSHDGQDADKVSADAPVCVHPKSQKRRIRHVSNRHISTGSTVSSFMSQHSIDTESVSVVSSLFTIHEHD